MKTLMKTQNLPVDFSRYQYHPVVKLPAGYEVFDFTTGYDPSRSLATGYGVGRYNEDRRGMYDAAIFRDGNDARTIHVGIDLGAPSGTPVHAFFAGEIFLTGYNASDGDYGHTLITRHELDGKPVWALHGHLSASSTAGKLPGQKFAAGDVIAWIGEKHENGGWNPHLHFQLSLVEPAVCDLPGVVSPAQLKEALLIYPDPRLVLGPLY